MSYAELDWSDQNLTHLQQVRGLVNHAKTI